MGDLLGTVLPPQLEVGTRMANRLCGLERTSPAQSIANKVFIYNGGAFRNTTDVNCPTVVQGSYL